MMSLMSISLSFSNMFTFYDHLFGVHLGVYLSTLTLFTFYDDLFGVHLLVSTLTCLHAGKTFFS